MAVQDTGNELDAQLAAGESFLWTGRPKQGIVLRNADILLIPLSLVWTAYAFFWEGVVQAMGGEATIVLSLLTLPFFVARIYLTIVRFFFDAKNRSNTFYGITPTRIIIRSGIFKITTIWYDIGSIADITMTERKDGMGTITFGHTNFMYTLLRGMDVPGVDQPPCLDVIPGVKTVYSLLIEQQQLQQATQI